MTSDQSAVHQRPATARRPLVSIGVPTCERSALLRRALSSLTAQDYPNLEIVISDNASTDDTAAVCADIIRSHPVVRYHRETIRVPAFRNFRNALVRSHGDYFMWASDDDLWEPSFVSTLVNILESIPELTLIAAEAQYILSDGERLPFFPEGQAFYGPPPRSRWRRIAMIASHGYGNLLYGLYRREAIVDPAGNTALDVCASLNELPFFVQVADRGGIRVHDSVLFYKTTSLPTYRQAAREMGFVPRSEDVVRTQDASVGRRSQPDLVRSLPRWSRHAAGIFLYHARAMIDISRALWRTHGAPASKIALLLAFAARLTAHSLKLALVWPVQDVLSDRARP